MWYQNIWLKQSKVFTTKGFIQIRSTHIQNTWHRLHKQLTLREFGGRFLHGTQYSASSIHIQRCCLVLQHFGHEMWNNLRTTVIHSIVGRNHGKNPHDACLLTVAKPLVAKYKCAYILNINTLHSTSLYLLVLNRVRLNDPILCKLHAFLHLLN